MADDEIKRLQERVTQLEAQVNYLYTHLGVNYATDSIFDNPRNVKIIEQIRQGKLIEAIKIHRELYNSDLIEAKRAVEDMRKRLGL